jgi:hypothetical protein
MGCFHERIKVLYSTIKVQNNYNIHTRNNEWRVWDNQEFIYHVNGNFVKDVDYGWIDSASTWILSWREEFEFNYSTSIDDIIVPEFYHELNPRERIPLGLPRGK